MKTAHSSFIGVDTIRFPALLKSYISKERIFWEWVVAFFNSRCKFTHKHRTYPRCFRSHKKINIRPISLNTAPEQQRQNSRGDVTLCILGNNVPIILLFIYLSLVYIHCYRPQGDVYPRATAGPWGHFFPVRSDSFHIYSYLLFLFICLIPFLLFPWASVWENTRAWVPRSLSVIRVLLL